MPRIEFEDFQQPETQESFSQQIQTASGMLGTDLIPSSVSNLNYEEFERRYPLRNRMYKSLVRLHEQGVVGGDPAFFDIFPLPRRIRLMNKLDGYIQNHNNSDQKVLRPRQLQALVMLHDQLESGRINSTGYFDLPTRFGKTVVFSELIKLADTETVVAVPTLITGSQAEDELIERLDIQALGRVFAGRREHGRQVTISTYDSLQRDIDRGIVDPKKVNLLVLDEAHLALGGKRPDMVKKFSNALILGFSATTKYSEKKQLRSMIPPLIFGMSTKEATEEGLLSSFSAYESRVEIDLDLSRTRVTAEGDYRDEDIERAVNNEMWNQGALEIYKREEINGKSAFIFCAGINHAKAMAELFAENGVVTEVISGKNKVNEQRDILRRFRNGQTKVLTSSDLLVTGVNEPNLDVVINARPTLSVVMAGQRGGRPLTLNSENPRKHAIIVDMVARNSSGVTYADVVTQQAEGITVVQNSSAEKQKPSTSAFEKKIEVRGMHVNVFTEEALKILETIKALDTEEQYTAQANINVDGIVRLLGRRAKDIARDLPYYFLNSRVGRVAEKFKEQIQAFEKYEEGINSELRLPVGVFSTMIADEIYLRLRQDSIIAEAPRMVRNIRRNLTRVARDIPEVEEELQGFETNLEQFNKLDLTDFEGRMEAVHEFEYRMKKFTNIKDRINLPARDKTTADVHHSLNQARQVIFIHKHSEQQTVLRKKITMIMKEDPFKILTFLNAMDTYRGTEFYQDAEEFLDPAAISNRINDVEVSVLMDPMVPEGALQLSNELRAVTNTLRQKSHSIENVYQQLVQFRQQMSDLREATNIDKARVDAYTHFNAIVDSLVEALGSAKAEMNNTIQKPKDRETAFAEIDRLKRGVNSYKENKSLLRASATSALIDDPESLGNATDGFFKKTSTLRDKFLPQVRKNPHFAQIKLSNSTSSTLTQDKAEDLARSMSSALDL